MPHKFMFVLIFILVEDGFLNKSQEKNVKERDSLCRLNENQGFALPKL